MTTIGRHSDPVGLALESKEADIEPKLAVANRHPVGLALESKEADIEPKLAVANRHVGSAGRRVRRSVRPDRPRHPPP